MTNWTGLATELRALVDATGTPYTTRADILSRAAGALEALERVRKVMDSPYHGTYWGRVMVPLDDLLAAIEGDKK